MLDKGILVTLITGFTAVVVTVWITVDFCLYRRKKAAIRAAKADAFYRKPRAERCVDPFQQKKPKDKKVRPTKKPATRKLSVRKFVNFFTGKKGNPDADDKESVITKENDISESGTNSKRSITISRLEAGGSSKLSPEVSDKKGSKENGVSKKSNGIEEEDDTIIDNQNRSSPKRSVLGKIQSAPNITGKWTNAVTPSELPTGKKALPPLKGKTSSKQSQEGKPFSEERIKEESNSGEEVRSSNTCIELNEIKEKLKSKPPFKQKRSKTKMKIENDVFFTAGEQSEPKANSNEITKKPPLMKRLSRNRVDSVNDGSTSSTDTKETFMDDRASSTTSSSWTCDESSRKRTGSFSDSNTSSGSIELEKRKFRIKPLKRNQSNMSVTDTTPLT